ncbi:dimethylsulfonioproprionate lyase family protein [Mesorhizobium sp. B2-3-4]|uniref:dimethylsulfonioproprionate lyase family protein n=1 Tax=Mesorhizobium sp. B2-3-4 TaxID=2589959 RepID=UPI0011288BB6|nr:dimethylsulfonioproprionate lyase family protein [Mesorhizobium sp. B2-3-4]TPM38654.1 transcriptional regulator [Mesorhizobium sp. B2-3-4]
MTANPHPLGTFMDLLGKEMRSRMGNDPVRDAAHRRIFGDTALEAPNNSDKPPKRQPACRYLPECFAELEKAGGNLGKLGAALRDIEPHLDWNNQAERRKSPVLADNYADCFIVGPGGYVPSSTIEIGVSVMAPHMDYPDHRHPPEELYLVLSEGEWRQNANPWHEPGVGGVVYNSPDIVHAMRAGAKPLFAIWCLPLDNKPHPQG